MPDGERRGRREVEEEEAGRGRWGGKGAREGRSRLGLGGGALLSRGAEATGAASCQLSCQLSAAAPWGLLR